MLIMILYYNVCYHLKDGKNAKEKKKFFKTCNVCCIHYHFTLSILIIDVYDLSAFS